MATTPAFVPGESRGQRRLEGYSPRGHTESGMTEHACARTHTHTSTLRKKERGTEGRKAGRGPSGGRCFKRGD